MPYPRRPASGSSTLHASRTRVYRPVISTFFFFTDPACSELYTLSLHDALPICFFVFAGNRIVRRGAVEFLRVGEGGFESAAFLREHVNQQDRKSTRLNSSHGYISYAVFCLKKKKTLIVRA